ncbi:MAG: metal ABC transporter ATP-binding protein [Myxococcota bacterium]
MERDGEPVLEDLSFQIAEGQFVGIVGPNGAGKTTLLRMLLGLVPASAGTARVLGQPPGRLPPAAGVGYVPQRSSSPSGFPATVRDVVGLGLLRTLGVLRRPDARARRRVEESLERVGLGALRDRPIGRLSGGEQRRVLLAQALAAGSRLLLLDEPTIGLDLPAEHEFYALLRRLQAELSLTILAVSHDLVALAGQADSLLCINRRMHVHGNPEEVVHSHAIREAYSCEFDFLAGELAHHGSHGP